MTTPPKTGAEIIEEWRNPPDGLYRSHADLAQMIDKRIAEVEAERDARIRELEAERESKDDRIAELTIRLQDLVPVGIEQSCDECGGNSANCLSDCPVRCARQYLDADTAKG